MQEPNFCHDSNKTLANMRQVCQGAVGFCQKIVTVKWNYCAYFNVVVTVIQIMSVTEETELLELSSLALLCYI